MAYEKQTFTDGEVLTAENLNHTEDGLQAAASDIERIEAAMSAIFPVGGIILWSGTVDNIPAGWALCDGKNGAPDLRDRFVVGAGNEYQPKDEGGEKEVTLTADQMPEHQHTIGSMADATAFGSTVYFTRGDVGSKTGTMPTGKSGSSLPHNNLPPYFALCYIMKLSTAAATQNLDAMSKTELLAYANEIGAAGVSSAMTKAKIIEAIRNAM